MIDGDFLICFRIKHRNIIYRQRQGLYNLSFLDNLQHVMLLLIYANLVVYTYKKRRLGYPSSWVLPLLSPIRKHLNFSELLLSSSTSSLYVYVPVSISAGVYIHIYAYIRFFSLLCFFFLLLFFSCFIFHSTHFFEAWCQSCKIFLRSQEFSGISLSIRKKLQKCS